MKQTLSYAACALAASLLLVACKDAPAPPSGGAKVAGAPVSISAIEAEVSGFTLGSSISARTVYVFFDAQCPHCAALWGAAKPLRSQAKFIWVPVAVMNQTSEMQGATLLGSKNPVASMDEHEASLSAGKGGIAVGTDIEANREVVRKNTAVMNRFGFASIPTIVAQHAQTGAMVTQEGSLPTPLLAKLLGLAPPSN